MPTAHGVQVGDPAAEEKVLGGQSWQMPLASLNEPAAHGVHKDTVVTPVREWLLPAGQMMHAERPEALPKVPAGQRVKEAAPVRE